MKTVGREQHLAQINKTLIVGLQAVSKDLFNIGGHDGNTQVVVIRKLF
jgi:hypothetical protein